MWITMKTRQVSRRAQKGQTPPDLLGKAAIGRVNHGWWEDRWYSRDRLRPVRLTGGQDWEDGLIIVEC